MSLDSKLPNPNPFSISSWFVGIIGALIEILLNVLVLTYAETTELKIILISSVTLLILGGSVFHILNRRKKMVEILYDEKKHIEKKERIPLYKLGKKYDLSKGLLLNRVAINRKKSVIGLNLSGFNLDKIPRKVKKLQNLTQIKCKESSLSSLYKIAKTMRNLENLEFMKTELTNLDGISKLKKLRILKMTECGIQDISAITELTELEEINLIKNKIINIEALAGMKVLRRLHLSENQINDISTLDKLENLRTVSVSLNPINNFTAIIKRKMEDISFSVMYKAYNKEITREELTKIKNDLVEQFKKVRTPHRFSRTMEGGLEEFGYTVSLHGNTVDD